MIISELLQKGGGAGHPAWRLRGPAGGDDREDNSCVCLAQELWASPSHLWNGASSFPRISSSVLAWSQGPGLTKTDVGVFTNYRPFHSLTGQAACSGATQSGRRIGSICPCATWKAPLLRHLSGRHTHMTVKWAWP